MFECFSPQEVLFFPAMKPDLQKKKPEEGAEEAKTEQ